MVKKKRQSDASENCGDSTESCDDSQCKNCPHISKAIDLTKVRKYVQQNGISRICSDCQKMPPDAESSKEDFVYDITLWLCLKCGSQGCGRTRNEHALKHFKTPRSDLHCININTETLQIWCYNCDKDLNMTSAKKLTESVEYIKKVSANSSSIETVIKNTLNNMEPLLKDTQAQVISTGSIPKSNVSLNKTPAKVKGLTNLGNTCFFNAVLQCLAQTPFLLDVIGEMSEPGEKFILPGGKIMINDKEEVLEPISGELKAWGSITQALHSTLYELSNGLGGGVVTPNRLLGQLTTKFPQFGGGDQHDSHELLRHLLEAVRSEDIRRYQSVILKHLNLGKIATLESVDPDCKMKTKFYGNQVAEGIMRAEQVFRGSLVSTLTCQDCMHTSIRHESFLDISLPISSDKPQPPRRRLSPDPVDMYVIGGKQDRQNDTCPPISKHQLKKERRNARKGRKHHPKGVASPSNDSMIAEEGAPGADSSSEQSDADIEDNIDEPHKNKIASSTANQNNNDANGNCRVNTLESGYNSEKHANSDCVRTSPIMNADNSLTNNINGIISKKESEPGDSSKKNSDFDSGVASPDNNKDIGNGQMLKNEVVALGLSMRASANFVDSRQKQNTPHCSSESGSEEESPLSKVVNKLENIALEDDGKDDDSEIGACGYSKSYKQATNKVVKDKVPSKADGWITTLGSRYICDESECSIQSCLNQFTALELMTGNNKVCCDACTERINGAGGKSVNTNATKQFLISSPPPVLILHLKRFQVGPRCMFRKLTKSVTFPIILDIAPFCGAKVKDLPNVSSSQNKLLYSLYGVVEHSGGMRGGHYVAYVKSRNPLTKSDSRWGFLLNRHKPESNGLNKVNGKSSGKMKKDDDSSLSGYESEDGPSQSEKCEEPEGKWYYISDSYVKEVTEKVVLNTQAYLLFYERIL